MFRLFLMVCSSTCLFVGLPFELFSSVFISKDDVQSKTLVYDCVSALDGDYLEKDIDLTVKGPTDIEIVRYYNSKNEKDSDGWKVFPHTILLIGNTNQKALIGEHGGTILPYVINSKNEYKIDLLNCFGLVNNAKEISGQTNYRNNALKQIDSNTYELTTGDGSKRIYKKSTNIQNSTNLSIDLEIFQKISKKLNDCSYFYLDYEILPSKNKRFYKYDSFGRVIRIESKNSLEKSTFGWVDISYEDQKVAFKTSDKQILEYYFQKSSFSKNQLLTKVISTKNAEIKYKYDKNDNLIEKHLPNGSLFKIEYIQDKNAKDFGRVSSIYTLKDNTEIKLYDFKYEFKKSSKDRIISGVTHVTDSKNVKRDYSYNEFGEIEKIETYLPNKKLYKILNQKWGKNENAANIITEFTQDSSQNILKYKTYNYDKFGNVVEETLYGNLTGKNQNFIILDKNGSPTKDNERYTIKSRYSSDGFNLLVSRGDPNLSEIKYEYLQNTNLITTKLICFEKWVKKRFFYKYDENAVLIKSIEDDGDVEYLCNDIQEMGISKSFITEIIPNLDLSNPDLPNFGYPKISSKKYLDTKDGKKHLLTKNINTFDKYGNVISTEIFDADDNLCYKDTFKYDLKGNLISSIDRLNNETLYSYDSYNNLLSEETKDVKKIYKYDLNNNKIEETEIYSNGLNYTKKIEYDEFSNLISETDIFGNITKYEYDSLSRLIKAIYPAIQDEDGKMTFSIYKYEYDIFDNVVKINDPKGFITKKSYNARDQITEISYPDKTSEKFAYDLQGSLHRKLLRDATVLIYQYDFLGRVALEEHFTSAETGPGYWLGDKTYEYDAFNLIYFSEDEGRGIKYKYNCKGQLISRYAAIENDNENDETLKNLDITGPKTDYKYDSLGRVIGEKRWYGKDKTDFYQIKRKYNLSDNVTEEIIEDANEQLQVVKRFEYDDRNRLVCRYEESYVVEKITYDAQDQKKSIEDAQNNLTTFDYDYSFTNSLGQKVLLITQNLPNKNKKIFEYDALNNISSVTVINSNNIEISKEKYFYDEVSNLTVKTVSNFVDGKEISKNQTKWIYGPLNRLEKIIEGYGSGNAKVTVFEYNKLGQLTKKYIPGIEKPITYTYGFDDEYSPNKFELSYCPTLTITYPELKLKDEKIVEGKKSLTHLIYFDKNYKIVRAESPNDVLVERKYDDFGNLIKERIKNAEFSDYKILYNYDRLGRVIDVKLPDKSKIEYQYKGYFPKKVRRLDADGNEKYFHEYCEFDEKGNLVGETLVGSAGKRKNVFDSLNRKTEVITDCTNLKIDEFDSNSNIIKLTKNNSQRAYAYESLDQLIVEKGSFNHSYEYDSLNNFTQIDDKKCNVNQLNELLQAEDIICEYDQRGMLFKKSDSSGSSIFINNAFGNLTDIVFQDKSTIRYTYDIFGRRLSKEYNSENENHIENYIYLGNEEVGVIKKNNEIKQLKILGAYYNLDTGRALAFELNDKIFVPIYDFQGNIVSLIDYFIGNVIESYDYSAFGEERIFNSNNDEIELTEIENPWRFAAKRKDDVTKLICFGFRDYDLKIKRWINPDPMGFIDGVNKYAFVSNNPLKYTDLLGLSSHHYYTKHESFDDYFYYKRTEDYTKGADTNVLALYDNSFWERFGTSVSNDLDLLVNTADKILEALDILQTGIGLIEIGAGLAGLGGSGGMEIASFGLGSPVAIPVVAGSLALIADGAVKIGIGISCKMAENTNSNDKNIVRSKSSGQLQKQIEKGQAPRSIERVDKGRGSFEKDHIHFKDNSALNIDGTWKHGEKVLTQQEIKWILKNGWKIPKIL